MRVEFNLKELSKGLQATVGTIAKQRDLRPILENILIKAENNSVVLYATDLSISLTYILPSDSVNILEEGSLLIPAAKMFSIIREMPGPEVYMENEKLDGSIHSQDGKIKIFGENAQKFPEIPKFADSESFEVQNKDLHELIKKTIFATTTEKTRFELDNILAIIDEDKVKFISTDGKRLAMVEKSCQNSSNLSKLVTIPRQGLQQVERLLSFDDDENLVTIGFVENQILFKTSNAMLSTQLSEAQFPPYEKIIPKKSSLKIILKTEEFASALKRIALMTDEKNKIVEMHFTNNQLQMVSSNLRYGEANLSLPVEYQGEDFDIKFNPDFFMDMMKVLDKEEVSLELNDSVSPGLIREGEDFTYVVLPIRPQDKLKAVV